MLQKCPQCGSVNYCKDGIVKQRQRYRCKDCNYHYTVEQRKSGKPAHLKRIALEMSLKGATLREIGEKLGVSHVTVFTWVKRFTDGQ